MELSKISFTSGRIEHLKCDLNKSQTIYWDAKTANLGLRVTPSQAKSYVFEAWFNGKSLRMTIGDTVTWPLKKAQNEARRLKVLVDQGIDPREERKKLNAQTVARQLKSISA